MAKYHGIIFAYKDAPELGDLTRERTVASLPFCGRYRLIDFALSSMRNAGITDVGVIMARDYQSLLDHIGSGKDWDMSRRSGGLRMLPPFGLPHAHTGNYAGTVEALNAVASYIRDIPQQHIVLLVGSVIDNVGDDGFVKEIFLYRGDSGKGMKSLEGYIIRKDVLLRLLDEAGARNHYAFHRHAIVGFLNDGGKMNVYCHKGYVCSVRNVAQYYKASMDMLKADIRHQIFPADRPVRTKIHEEVSTYYGEHSVSKNSLVADNCIIEGEIENCIVFSGCRIGAGTKLKNSIVMRGVTIGENADLNYVIVDKYVSFSDRAELKGSPRLPTVVRKGSNI